MLLKITRLLLIMLFPCLNLNAQFEVRTEQATATYAPGDTAWIILSSSQSGLVGYTFRYDRFTSPISMGNINLIAGQPSRFPLIYNEPGVVHAQFQQGGNNATISLVFDPLQIKPLVEEPIDFDNFWSVKKAELANIPIDPKLTEIGQTAYSTTYRINLATVANRRVYGYISIPKGAGPFPAILSLPSFGDGANIVQPEPTISEQGGAISMTISIHNAEPDAIDPNAYQPDDISQPGTYYFRWAIQAGLRAIDYLFTRQDFDQQHLGVVGVSQGGGLAIMLAGLDQRVNLLATSNPAYCQHAGLTFGKASGFPYLLNNSRNSNGTASHEAATLTASSYYEAAFFARRFKGPALMVISYQDDICPPATSFAAFNQLTGSKVLLHARDLGHTHPPEYWNGRFDFFRQHFPPMRTPPWPWPSTTTGYLTFAGNDQSINASAPALLQGRIFFNNQEVNTWPVSWKKVSGPGAVIFNPENAPVASATFGAAGNYLLQFCGRDLSLLNNQGLFYSAIDALVVEVDGSGQTDTQAPSVILQTQSNLVNGPFEVDVNFNEPIIGFSLLDIVAQNATLAGLSGNNTSFQFTATPVAEGNIRLQLPARQVQDTAGNNNLASNELLLTYEDTSNVSTPNQELLILSAQLQGKKVLLSWVTNTDFENQQYTLQRSTDSITFRAIKIIPSENRPAGNTQYQIEDGQPLPGKSFYRIVQLGKNGEEKNSNIIGLSIDFNTTDFSLYPVPSADKVFVNLSEYAGQPAKLNIYDLKGRLIDNKHYEELPAETLELDVSNWEDGLYCIRFSIKGFPRFSRKFTVFKDGQ